MFHHAPLRRRFLAGGLAASALLVPATVAAGTVAATTVVGASVAVAAPTNAAAATTAGTWLASQFKDGQYYLSPYTSKADAGTTADGILGLVASGSSTALATAKTADAWLQDQAKTVTSAGQLAKLALVAEAMGDDPTNYGGVDLLTKITESVTASGADLTGQYTGYGDALEIIALARGGAAVPTVLINGLVSQQQSDGSVASDADTTGLAIAALSDVKEQSASAATALTKAIAWADSKKLAAGYWDSYSPSNTAGLIGSALLDQGKDESTTATWLVSQQKKAGGKGLPATLDDASPDFYATAQGLLLLGGQSLNTVKVTAASASATPSASVSATVTPAGTSSPISTTTAGPTATATTTDTSTATATSTWITTEPGTQPLPATGDGGDGAAWLLVGAGVCATIGGVALRARRK